MDDIDRYVNDIGDDQHDVLGKDTSIYMYMYI